jgi:hypothetical protein
MVRDVTTTEPQRADGMYTAAALGAYVGTRVADFPASPSSAIHDEIDFIRPESFEFDFRSTEGIIYYLAEVVHRELYPDYGSKRERSLSSTIRPRM